MTAERATKEVAEFTIPSSLDIQDVLKRARERLPPGAVRPGRNESVARPARAGNSHGELKVQTPSLHEFGDLSGRIYGAGSQ
jgi:hypothetical protein